MPTYSEFKRITAQATHRASTNAVNGLTLVDAATPSKFDPRTQDINRLGRTTYNEWAWAVEQHKRSTYGSYVPAGSGGAAAAAAASTAAASSAAAAAAAAAASTTSFDSSGGNSSTPTVPSQSTPPTVADDPFSSLYTWTGARGSGHRRHTAAVARDPVVRFPIKLTTKVVLAGTRRDHEGLQAIRGVLSDEEWVSLTPDTHLVESLVPTRSVPLKLFAS